MPSLESQKIYVHCSMPPPARPLYGLVDVIVHNLPEGTAQVAFNSIVCDSPALQSPENLEALTQNCIILEFLNLRTETSMDPGRCAENRFRLDVHLKSPLKSYCHLSVAAKSL